MSGVSASPVSTSMFRPCCVTRAALLADGLAPAVLERGQEVVEIPIAAIVPVVLYALALEQPGRAELVPLVFAAEGHVQRRHAELLGRAHQAVRERDARRAALTRPDQQARPGTGVNGTATLSFG